MGNVTDRVRSSSVVQQSLPSVLFRRFPFQWCLRACVLWFVLSCPHRVLETKSTEQFSNTDTPTLRSFQLRCCEHKQTVSTDGGFGILRSHAYRGVLPWISNSSPLSVDNKLIIFFITDSINQIISWGIKIDATLFVLVDIRISWFTAKKCFTLLLVLFLRGQPNKSYYVLKKRLNWRQGLQ